MMTTDATARPTPETTTVRVAAEAAEAYRIEVRGHHLSVDQPVDSGGLDSAPTPVELFVASLASCVAFYAGRWLTRHGYSRQGLAVTADFEMAVDRPARVAAIRLDLRVPAEVPPDRWPALRAVATHCTVHNSLIQPPRIDLTLA